MTDKPSPQPCDVLLGCIHRPNPYAAHVFHIPGCMPFTRPDGTFATAKWIVICEFDGERVRRFAYLDEKPTHDEGGSP
jgi:hypothetical protein